MKKLNITYDRTIVSYNGVLALNNEKIICPSCNDYIYFADDFIRTCTCKKLIYCWGSNSEVFHYILNDFKFNYDGETYITDVKNTFNIYSVFGDYCFLNKTNEELLNKLKLLVLL